MLEQTFDENSMHIDIYSDIMDELKPDQKKMIKKGTHSNSEDQFESNGGGKLVVN